MSYHNIKEYPYPQKSFEEYPTRTGLLSPSMNGRLRLKVKYKDENQEHLKQQIGIWLLILQSRKSERTFTCQVFLQVICVIAFCIIYIYIYIYMPLEFPTNYAVCHRKMGSTCGQQPPPRNENFIEGEGFCSLKQLSFQVVEISSGHFLPCWWHFSVQTVTDLAILFPNSSQ